MIVKQVLSHYKSFIQLKASYPLVHPSIFVKEGSWRSLPPSGAGVLRPVNKLQQPPVLQLPLHWRPLQLWVRPLSLLPRLPPSSFRCPHHRL